MEAAINVVKSGQDRLLDKTCPETTKWLSVNDRLKTQIENYESLGADSVHSRFATDPMVESMRRQEALAKIVGADHTMFHGELYDLRNSARDIRAKIDHANTNVSTIDTKLVNIGYLVDRTVSDQSQLSQKLQTLQGATDASSAEARTSWAKLQAELALLQAHVYAMPSHMRDIAGEVVAGRESAVDADEHVDAVQRAMLEDGIRPDQTTALENRQRTVAERVEEHALTASRHDRLLGEANKRQAHLEKQAVRVNAQTNERLEAQENTINRLERRFIDMETKLRESDTRNAALSQKNSELEETIERMRSGLANALNNV